MSDNTALALFVIALIGAAVALIVTGHGAWVVGALLIFYVLIGS